MELSDVNEGKGQEKVEKLSEKTLFWYYDTILDF